MGKGHNSHKGGQLLNPPLNGDIIMRASMRVRVKKRTHDDNRRVHKYFIH